MESAADSSARVAGTEIVQRDPYADGAKPMQNLECRAVASDRLKHRVPYLERQNLPDQWN
jgi:hypothetical protein